jgi:hypothetical protein
MIKNMKKIIFIFSLILATSSAQADFQSKIETLLNSFKDKVGTTGNSSCAVYTKQGRVDFKALTLILEINGSTPLDLQSNLESWLNLNTKESTTANGATLFTRETFTRAGTNGFLYFRKELEIIEGQYIRYEFFTNNTDSSENLPSFKKVTCKF